MPKTEQLPFEDFLSDVIDDYKEFTSKTHELLLSNAYKFKVEAKAAGHFVSYSNPKTKRSLLNFFFRKNGLHVRVYPESHDKYGGLFFNTLPAAMIKEITKASVCKRLIDPNDCNPKCIMGYEFAINGVEHKKCRYNCFQFLVNAESIPFISEFIGNELKNYN